MIAILVITLAVEAALYCAKPGRRIVKRRDASN